MANYSDALRGLLSPEEIAQLDTAVELLQYDEGLETVTSGAMSVSKRTTLVTIADTKTYTLADGTREGQRKTIRVVSTSGSPDGTLTPDTFASGASIDLDAANECVELQWTDASGWYVVQIAGATINA